MPKAFSAEGSRLKRGPRCDAPDRQLLQQAERSSRQTSETLWSLFGCDYAVGRLMRRGHEQKLGCSYLRQLLLPKCTEAAGSEETRGELEDTKPILGVAALSGERNEVEPSDLRRIHTCKVKAVYGFRGKAYKARTEEEMSRLGERLRQSPFSVLRCHKTESFQVISGAAADGELQLRQELQQSEQSRLELQARDVFVLSATKNAEQLRGDIAPERNEWWSFQAGVVVSRVNGLSRHALWDSGIGQLEHAQQAYRNSADCLFPFVFSLALLTSFATRSRGEAAREVPEGIDFKTGLASQH